MKNRCFKKNMSLIGTKHIDVIPTVWRVQIYHSHPTTTIGCPVRSVKRLPVDASNYLICKQSAGFLLLFGGFWRPKQYARFFNNYSFHTSSHGKRLKAVHASVYMLSLSY